MPADDSLIEYPSRFPIKVMGAHVEGFVEAIAFVAQRFDPEFDPLTIEQRPSKAGNYLGLTITVTATTGPVFHSAYRGVVPFILLNALVGYSLRPLFSSAKLAEIEGEVRGELKAANLS